MTKRQTQSFNVTEWEVAAKAGDSIEVMAAGALSTDASRLAARYPARYSQEAK